MNILTGPKPSKMVECPACKGEGKEHATVRTIQPDRPVEKRIVTITCSACSGRKKITRQLKVALERQNELWCHCRPPSSEDIIFHDDNTCKQCQKHHYHCGSCGKITQVG
jgi:hypothetical protein